MGGVGGGVFNDANKDSINQNFMISSAFCENRFDEKYFREGDGWGGWWCRGQFFLQMNNPSKKKKYFREGDGWGGWWSRGQFFLQMNNPL